MPTVRTNAVRLAKRLNRETTMQITDEMVQAGARAINSYGLFYAFDADTNCMHGRRARECNLCWASMAVDRDTARRVLTAALAPQPEARADRVVVAEGADLPQPYRPAVIEYTETGYTEFVLRDCSTINDWGEHYASIKDIETGEVIGFVWPTKINPAEVPGRAPAPSGMSKAVERLRAEDVEWVVNDIAELGVKIGNQFFWLYKGYSLVYGTDEASQKAGVCLNEDTDPPTVHHWRPVFKREFGECAHPINYNDPTRIGTVSLDDSDEWKPLPAAALRNGEGGT